MDCMSAPDRRRAGLANAERAHLAGPHQLGHGAERVLDRYVGIDPVNEIEIDDFGLQTLEAFVAAFLHIFGTPVGKARTALELDIAEFAGDHVIAAMPRDSTGDQLLIAAPAIGI